MLIVGKYGLLIIKVVIQKEGQLSNSVTEAREIFCRRISNTTKRFRAEIEFAEPLKPF